jgi:HEAT repeat protein
LGDVRSVQPLISALENGDRIVKWEAVRALNRIGTQDALTAVREHERRTQGRSRIKRLLAATFLSA